VMAIAMPLLQVILGVIVLLPYVLIAGLWGDPEGVEDAAVVLAPVLSLAAIGPLLLWGWWRTGRSFAETFYLTRIPLPVLPAVLLVSIGGTICFSELDNLTRYFVPLPNFSESAFEKIFNMPFLGAVLLGIVAPITEEPLFRALLLGGLARRGWRWTAILYTSFLFGVVHLNPAQVPFACVFGILVGWMLLRTGSLWPCLLVHAVNNLTPVALMNLPIPEIPGYNSEPAAGLFQPLWFDAIGVTCFIIGIMALLAVTQSQVRSAAAIDPAGGEVESHVKGETQESHSPEGE